MTYMSSDRPWSKDIASETCFIIRSPPMYRIRGVSSVLVCCYQWMVIIQMPGVDLIRLVKILVLNGIWIRTHEALMISFICKPQNQIYSEISTFNSLFSSLINGLQLQCTLYMYMIIVTRVKILKNKTKNKLTVS